MTTQPKPKRKMSPYRRITFISPGTNAEKQKIYWKNHPEKYENHLRIVRKNSQKHYYKNRHQILQELKNKRLLQEPWESIFAGMRQHSKKLRFVFGLSKKEFAAWYVAQPKVCVYCSQEVCHFKKKARFNSVSVDRKDNQKGYMFDNMGISCYFCNRTKNSTLTYSEMVCVGNTLKTIWAERNRHR
ncbi:MAG: hypothetical protein Q8O88_01430 [bacterium]|nr:hypothetical protein [bacterium]